MKSEEHRQGPLDLPIRQRVAEEKNPDRQIDITAARPRLGTAVGRYQSIRAPTFCRALSGATRSSTTIMKKSNGLFLNRTS